MSEEFGDYDKRLKVDATGILFNQTNPHEMNSRFYIKYESIKHTATVGDAITAGASLVRVLFSYTAPAREKKK